MLTVFLAPPEPIAKALDEVVLVQTTGMTLVAAKCRASGADRVRTLTVRGKVGTAVLPDEWGTVPCAVKKSELEGWDYTAGEEQTSMDIRARAVVIDGAPPAILVSVRAGFEHVHRFHALFVGAKEGRVKRAWERGDGQGPAVSRVDLQDGALTFTWTFDYGGEDLADGWYRKRASWDPKKSAIVETDAPAWMVIASTRDSLLAAREIETDLESACGLRDLLVFETDAWPTLAKGKWIVAQPAVSSSSADAQLAALQKCAPDAYVKPVR